MRSSKLQSTTGFPRRLCLSVSFPLHLSAHLQNDLQWDSGNADSHQGSDTSWGHGAPPPVSREMRIAALIAWDLSPPMKANFGSLEPSVASYYTRTMGEIIA